VKKENKEYRVKLVLLANVELMVLLDLLVLEGHLAKMGLMAFLDLPDLPVKKELMELMELLDHVEHPVLMVSMGLLDQQDLSVE
jgi:hypothetical protein